MLVVVFHDRLDNFTYVNIAYC